MVCETWYTRKQKLYVPGPEFDKFIFVFIMNITSFVKNKSTLRSQMCWIYENGAEEIDPHHPYLP